jgi:hypothetical protein
VSNDNINWVQLDQQIDRDWASQEWSEVYFPVETNEVFSYFKFIQTGKSYNNLDYFQLTYLELFGTIFEN